MTPSRPDEAAPSAVSNGNPVAIGSKRQIGANGPLAAVQKALDCSEQIGNMSIMVFVRVEHLARNWIIHKYSPALSTGADGRIEKD